MNHSIAITLPENLFQFLAKEAAETKQSLEDAASEMLVAMLQNMSEDLVLKQAGTIHTDIRNVGDRHDELIGHALRQELQGHGS